MRNFPLYVAYIEVMVYVAHGLSTFKLMKESIELLQGNLHSLGFRIKIIKLPLRCQRDFGCELLIVKIQHRNLMKILNNEIVYFLSIRYTIK